MDRAKTAAVKANLGEWRQTNQFNRNTEGFTMGPGLLCIVAALLWAGLIWLVNEPPLTFSDFVPFGVLSLVGIALIAVGLLTAPRGRLLVHRFQCGLVMERTRGGVYAARYDDIGAQLWSYLRPGDSETEPADHWLLRIRISGAGDYVLDETADGPPDLRDLAEHCGAGDPQPIDAEAAEQLRLTTAHM